MVSLSRYTIRAGIVLVILVSTIGIVSTSLLISQVQNNLSTAEDLRISHSNLDQEIEERIFVLSSNVDLSLNFQIESFLDEILTGDSDDIDIDFSQSLDTNLTQLVNFLETRRNSNYNLTGVDEGSFGLGTLGIQIPDTTQIIDDTTTGAYLLFSDFIFFARTQITNINNQGEFFRTQLQNDRNSLESVNQDIQTDYNQVSGHLTNLTNSLITNGTSEALEILPHVLNMSTTFNELLYRYHESYVDLTTSSDTLDIQEFNNEIGQIRAEIETVNTTILALGLNTFDSEIYGNINSNILLIFDSLDIITDNISSYLTRLQNITNFVTDDILELNEEFSDIFAQLRQIITDESNNFNEELGAFLRELRSAQNSQIFLVFGTLAAITFVIFTWIFLTLSLNLRRILGKIISLEEGNLLIKTRESYPKNEIGVLEKSLDSFANQIRGIIDSMKRTSNNLAGISEELAAGAEEASASINEVNSTVREFSSGSVEQTLMLGRVRDELIDHLDIVEQTAQRIDETAKFVLLVAKRTNILGLNASIEAAKAGRFGLGFNVVAEEVRNLSNETRLSARDIKNNIEEIEFNIRQTVEDILTEVNIIREVAQNTSTGSEDASIATSEQVTMMSEVSETSNQLSEISQQLNGMMKNFKT